MIMRITRLLFFRVQPRLLLTVCLPFLVAVGCAAEPATAEEIDWQLIERDMAAMPAFPRGSDFQRRSYVGDVLQRANWKATADAVTEDDVRLARFIVDLAIHWSMQMNGSDRDIRIPVDVMLTGFVERAAWVEAIHPYLVGPMRPERQHVNSLPSRLKLTQRSNHLDESRPPLSEFLGKVAISREMAFEPEFGPMLNKFFSSDPTWTANQLWSVLRADRKDRPTDWSEISLQINHALETAELRESRVRTYDPATSTYKEPTKAEKGDLQIDPEIQALVARVGREGGRVGAAYAMHYAQSRFFESETIIEAVRLNPTEYARRRLGEGR